MFRSQSVDTDETTKYIQNPVLETLGSLTLRQTNFPKCTTKVKGNFRQCQENVYVYLSHELRWIVFPLQADKS